MENAYQISTLNDNHAMNSIKRLSVGDYNIDPDLQLNTCSITNEDE